MRRTGFSGEIRGGSAGVDVDGVVRARHLAHGEPHGRIGNVEDDVDAVVLDPLPRDVGADVGLVLVVGEDDFDRPAQHLAAVILDRHARGVDRAHAGQIRVQSRLVVEDTELHRLLRDRGGGEPRSPQHERERGDNVATHENPPLAVATAECWSCWRDRTGEEHHCKAGRWQRAWERGGALRQRATEQRRAIGRTGSVQSLLTGLPRQVHAAGGSAALHRSEQDVTRLTERGRQK